MNSLVAMMESIKFHGGYNKTGIIIAKMGVVE